MRGKNVNPNMVASPARIAEYYKEHRKDFTSKEEVKLRMIMIPSKSAEGNAASQKAMAEEILGKLSNGSDFERMAQMYSEDSTRDLGGDWGWIERQTLAGPLESVAFSLPVGKVSKIIELGGNYYILKVDERRGGVTKPLAAIREDVEKKIAPGRRAALAGKLAGWSAAKGHHPHVLVAPVSRLRIGLTLGDAAGHRAGDRGGRALKSPALPDCDFVVVGEYPAVEPGRPTPDTARAAAAALEEAVAAAIRGDLAAVVTGPIHKARMYEIGFKFPGQTEFFADRCGVENFAMLLTGGALSVALVTTHVPLRRVADDLSQKEIVRVGGLLFDFLQRRLGRAPRIAVAGLNPHAGESGAIGRGRKRDHRACGRRVERRSPITDH